MENEKKRGSFTGSLGFVLAAAGSAVGLGNLWRFPYLAAKDGGGLFVVVYIILALTFGFALMTTEIALGRKTEKSPINAFKIANSKFTWVGYMGMLVPMVIFPYYCVIGGWVTKYAFEYIIGNGAATIDPTGGFFYQAIGRGDTIQITPILWFLLFMIVTAVIVYFGVDKGIEKCSVILMPLLVVIIVGIAVYSLTLKDAESGRTALEGLKIYLIPNFEGMTLGKFLHVVLDAVGQLFFSMSLAMGIMITYGSYTKKDANLVQSVNRIELFDTGVALLAGLIMIPAVYCFMGVEGLGASGPGLMFVSLPQVFGAMGSIGNFVGAMFFILVIFAALTSSISILEAVVSMFMDRTGMSRKTAVFISVVIALVVGLIVCFGYNIMYMEIDLPNGAQNQQILDVLDWITNYLFMPVIAIATCVMFGWFTGTKFITDEVKRNGEKFGREKLYVVMVKYVCPILLFFMLLNSFGVFG